MVRGGRKTPTNVKVKAIVDFPTPTSKTEIRKILGMIGYYSRYIENYASVVEPLPRTLKGKTRKEGSTWTEEMEEAF